VQHCIIIVVVITSITPAKTRRSSAVFFTWIIDLVVACEKSFQVIIAL
jgi:hypothetical protein